MVERGWVERVRSTEDRRAQIVVLTPSGSQLVKRAQKIAATMEDETLRVLSPAERLLLLELLLKVSGEKGGGKRR
jgi:DNA-binding MarR family transcriptional regulator